MMASNIQHFLSYILNQSCKNLQVLIRNSLHSTAVAHFTMQKCPLCTISLQINIHINEKFRFCINHYAILPSYVNLDTVKFTKHSLNLVEAKAEGLSAKETFMKFSGVPGTQRFS